MIVFIFLFCCCKRKWKKLRIRNNLCYYAAALSCNETTMMIIFFFPFSKCNRNVGILSKIKNKIKSETKKTKTFHVYHNNVFTLQTTTPTAAIAQWNCKIIIKMANNHSVDFIIYFHFLLVSLQYSHLLLVLFIRFFHFEWRRRSKVNVQYYSPIFFFFQKITSLIRRHISLRKWMRWW